MKKVLKYIGITLLSLLGLVLLAITIIALKPLPNYQNEYPLSELEVDLTPERIKTGAEIASVSCNHCHGEKGVLQGKLFIPNSPFGDIYAPNITQHKTAGIGAYTDAELYRLFRTGIMNNGDLALPMMLRLPNAAEEDIYSIIAYLKSDNRAVQPSANQIPSYETNLLAKFLYTIAFKPLPYKEEQIFRPDPSDQIQYGYYLATALYTCADCHSASFETYNPVEPEKSPGYFGGGNPAAIGDMEPVLTANLTMDEEEGIGRWTSDEFLTALKYGKKPDGSIVRYPMLPYTFMDSSDAYAIYEYLKTIPEIGSQRLEEAVK